MQDTAALPKTDAPAQPGVAADKQVAQQPRQRLERIVVESAVPALDTAMFDHMMRIANVLASSGLVPVHLNAIRKVGGREEAISPEEARANCFLVVNQSVRWRMDPFSVAQHTFVTKGKIGYEGKLIAAVINTHPDMMGRLSYTYDGTGTQRKVTVTGKLAGDDAVKTVEGKVADWQTENENWRKGVDQMLSYRGAREWARRWLPEAILGVWGDDEIETFERGGTTSALEHQQPQKKGAAGLKAALTGATDLPAGGTTFEDAAQQNSAELDKGWTKLPATVERRDEFVIALGHCGDTDILALKRDEANAYDWTKPDLDVIEDAYRKRLQELEG